MRKQKVIHGVTVTLFSNENDFKAQNEKDTEISEEGFNIYTNYGVVVYGIFELKVLCIVPNKRLGMDIPVSKSVNKMYPTAENKAEIQAEILEFIESFY